MKCRWGPVDRPVEPTSAMTSFLFTQSVMILLAVVLGGMGKIPGVILGACAIVVFPEVFRGIGEYRMLIFGLLLLVLMIYRPQGLWPERHT